VWVDSGARNASQQEIRCVACAVVPGEPPGHNHRTQRATRSRKKHDHSIEPVRPPRTDIGCVAGQFPTECRDNDDSTDDPEHADAREAAVCHQPPTLTAAKLLAPVAPGQCGLANAVRVDHVAD